MAVWGTVKDRRGREALHGYNWKEAMPAKSDRVDAASVLEIALRHELKCT